MHQGIRPFEIIRELVHLSPSTRSTTPSSPPTSPCTSSVRGTSRTSPRRCGRTASPCRLPCSSRAACAAFVRRTGSTALWCGAAAFPRHGSRLAEVAVSVVKRRWVQSVRDQLQPHVGASGSSLLSPADFQQRQWQKQFADVQPRLYRSSYHSTADMDMDAVHVDQDLIFVDGDPAHQSPPSTLHLPSDMVLWARLRHTGSADPPPPAAVPDHFAIVVASQGAPP